MFLIYYYITYEAIQYINLQLKEALIYIRFAMPKM
jgi:hypothetical protein